MSDQAARVPARRFAGFESIPLEIHIRVGGARCRVGQLSELEPGQVIELDRRIGEPLELRAGPILLGRVEPVAERDGIAVKLVEVPEEDDGPGR